MFVYKFNNVFSHIEATLYEYYKNNPKFSKTVFVLGYNVLPSLDFLRKKFPGHKVIVYQLEQLYNGSMWVSNKAREILRSADEIWDYDEHNINWMRENYYLDARFKPMVYTKVLDVIPPIKEEECDIDVLFYGYLHERRAKFMFHLQHKMAGNFKVFDLYGVWGKDLDEYIRRSKIILNIHSSDFKIQEQPRIYYPVINGRCVLSETSIKNYAGNAIIEANYEDLLKATFHLLKDKNWLRVASQSKDLYKQISEKYEKI
jgi:hypothetical protein